MTTTLITEDNVAEIFDRYSLVFDYTPEPNEKFIGDNTIDSMIFFKSLMKDDFAVKPLSLNAEHDKIIISVRLDMMKDTFNEQDVETLCAFGICFDDDHDFFYIFT